MMFRRKGHNPVPPVEPKVRAQERVDLDLVSGIIGVDFHARETRRLTERGFYYGYADWLDGYNRRRWDHEEEMRWDHNTIRSG